MGEEGIGGQARGKKKGKGKKARMSACRLELPKFPA